MEEKLDNQIANSADRNRTNVSESSDQHVIPIEIVDADHLKQSEALTNQTFNDDPIANEGVGGQFDEHRGNSQGGFKYEELPDDDNPKPTSEELDEMLKRQQEMEEGDGWTANPCPTSPDR